VLEVEKPSTSLVVVAHEAEALEVPALVVLEDCN